MFRTMRRLLSTRSLSQTHIGRRALRQRPFAFTDGTSSFQLACSSSRDQWMAACGRNPWHHGRWLSSRRLLRNEETLPMSARKGDENHDAIKTLNSQPTTAESTVTESSDKQARRRRNAAKAIPYWLDKDIACFEQTMNALNLDLSSILSDSDNSSKPKGKKRNGRFGKQNSNTGGVLAEYRQLYKDSIIGFYETIHSDPSSLHPNMEPILDELADIGFDDLRWAKHFRGFKKFRNAHFDYSRRLHHLTRQHKKRVDELEKAKKRLEEIGSSKPPKIRDQPQEQSQTVAERVVHAMSSLLKSPESQEEPADGISNRKDKACLMAANRYETALEKQRRAVQQAQECVDEDARKLQTLKEDRDGSEPLLTKSEYDEADAVVRQLLQDISLAFANHIQKRHSHMIEQYRVLDGKTDLTKPHEWYQHARLDRRKIIFHGGPTNSGKTFEALQRLKTAKQGLYVGPLRLLAAEVYESLTSQGVYTSLYTGQEKREVPFATHMAATVEIAPTTQDFDVVVVDEIQMIADPFRGFAWSRALLGLRCKEIHVCGGLEAKAMVQRIAQVCGDDFEMKEYKRFGPLQVAHKSVSSKPQAPGSYSSVRPGDCVVAFSRNDIFAIKREIERSTKHKCCVIYGLLPPETRTEQARLFNDPNSGYDILVASDAIGMGLNLNIRRVIFNSMLKSNGETIVKLDHSAVKQISGRAGRRNSPYPSGEVTCRDPHDMDHLRKCMSTNVASIEKAGLLPTSDHIQHFSEALRTYELEKDFDNLHKILVQFEDMAKTKGDFFICRQTPMRIIAKMLDDLPLSISDKFTLCMAPAAVNNKHSLRTLRKFAEKYAAGEAPGLSGTLIPKAAKSFDDLSRLCSIYNELELFLWLSLRFPGNAVEQQTAQALKEEVINHIKTGLGESENLKLDHCYIQRDKILRESWKKNKDQRHGIRDTFDEHISDSQRRSVRQTEN